MNVPVLMYHSVSRDRDVDGSDFAVSESSFRRHLQRFRALGLNTPSVRDVMDGRAAFNERSVVLTFDDGYLDNYEVAFPLLQHFGFRATIFAVTDFARRSNWWDQRARPARLLEPSQMREMQRGGVEFGAHGVTHRSLLALDEVTRGREIVDARRSLEDALGAPVTTFAYPYGAVDEATKRAVRSAGYRAAFAVNSGPLSFFEDLFEVRRVLVTNRSDAPYLAVKLAGVEKLARCAARCAVSAARAARALRGA